MNLCSHNHEEICYEGRNCPFCAAISDKETEIENLKSEIDSHKETIQELRKDIDSQ